MKKDGSWGSSLSMQCWNSRKIVSLLQYIYLNYCAFESSSTIHSNRLQEIDSQIMFASQLSLYVLLAHLSVSCISAYIPARQLSLTPPVITWEFSAITPTPTSKQPSLTPPVITWEFPAITPPTTTKPKTTAKPNLLPPVITWEFPALPPSCITRQCRTVATPAPL